MALAATRRQRVIVNVVLAMAGDAHVAGSSEGPIVFMTPFAIYLIVLAVQRERADVMQWFDILKATGVVAGFANRAKLAFVDLWLFMAGETIGCQRFKVYGFVTRRTSHFEMLPFQRITTHGVVIERNLASFHMTLLATVP